jgi:peptide-methionine (S)-S-oxide reductase
LPSQLGKDQRTLRAPEAEAAWVPLGGHGELVYVDELELVEALREDGSTGSSPYVQRNRGTMTRRSREMAATEKAILAGGCFWGVQDLIRKLDGVSGTRIGYTGGDTPNATYRNHGSHAEAIEILFDPERISYRDLLEFFFQIHDPTTKNRQGNDVGASYRSAIYYVDDEQRRVAEDTIADVDASGLWPGKVVTEVRPAGPFWEAEPEHQDYLERYPNGYTCHFVRPGWKLPRRAREAAH